MEPQSRVDVESGEADCLIVRWEMVGDDYLDVAVGPTPDAADHAHVMRVPTSAGSVRLAALPAGRHYVSVSRAGITAIAAERRVRFAGLRNFRDLGGYPTDSGGSTRWGLVFRSDLLHALTPEDLVAFDALGIRTIYDLRRDEEREEAPGPRACVHLTLPSHRVGDTDPSTVHDRKAGEQWLFEDYCGMLAVAGPVFGRLFSRLAEADAGSAVFHCWGGKDRTGMTAALLLTWLGVNRELVLDDYELTTSYASAENLATVVNLFVEGGIPRRGALGMLSTPRWVMAEALAVLDDEFGGIEAYLLGPGEMTATAAAALRARLVV
jgi:protein-tyrosine phosphatase